MTAKTLSKEKIISAAIEIINSQESLTFTKLSKKLGTRAQSIYNYFPDVTAVKVAIGIHFYEELAKRLNADLLGLAGKQAVKAFANVSVQFALSKFLVAQQVLGIPKGRLQDTDLNSSFDEIHKILIIFLNPLVPDTQQQLVISRMLRNLIIGEIIHVGNERFDNKLMITRDSFDQMLEITLSGF